MEGVESVQINKQQPIIFHMNHILFSDVGVLFCQKSDTIMPDRLYISDPCDLLQISTIHIQHQVELRPQLFLDVFNKAVLKIQLYTFLILFLFIR